MDKNRLKLDALVDHIKCLGHELIELQANYQSRADAHLQFCVTEKELETMSNKMRSTAYYMDDCVSTCFEELKMAREKREIENRKGDNDGI